LVRSLSESAEALDPALLQPMVTAHAAYLNSSQSALSQALKESRQAQAAVSAAQAQTHAERKRADEAVAGGAKGGMSPAESEAMRGYVIKLQKKLKDTQQALADKSAHVAAVLRRSESARAAAEYEMQLDTLRRSLALRDEEYQALMKSFGELEKKVMQHERPADAKSEIIQFLQDQARQVMLMKRSAAEQQRRATASAHRWTAKEEELEVH
jgi:Mg2+ and Co2+ transporter CorA